MEGSRKRMLVTGASGFLGSRVVSYYRERCDVYGPGHGELDITERESVERVFERIRPDFVVHCAAVSDVMACEKDPEGSRRINVDGSRNIARASRQCGAKCLIASSDQVYFGSRVLEDHREEEILQPWNVYGREKLQAESECLDADSGCVLLRLSWMYDVRRIREGEHGDFFRILAAALETREALEYPVHDRRGITDINEVVQNLEKAFSLTGGIYNFGSPNDANMYETVRELFMSLEWDPAMLKKNRELYAAEPRNLSMDISRLEKNGIWFRPTVEALVSNGAAGIRQRRGRRTAGTRESGMPVQ